MKLKNLITIQNFKSNLDVDLKQGLKFYFWYFIKSYFKKMSTHALGINGVDEPPGMTQSRLSQPPMTPPENEIEHLSKVKTFLSLETIFIWIVVLKILQLFNSLKCWELLNSMSRFWINFNLRDVRSVPSREWTSPPRRWLGCWRGRKCWTAWCLKLKQIVKIYSSSNSCFWLSRRSE